MIKNDQPTCFPPNVLVAVSSAVDGTMLDRTTDIHHPDVVANRRRFCETLGGNYDDTAYMNIVYGDDRTYDTIHKVTERDATKHTSDITVDALITTSKNVALMLPVADCIATVVYAAQTNTLALLHLGRHSTLTPLLANVLHQMVADGAKPEEIIVWMSPNAHRSHYVMQWFDRADDPAWTDFCTKEADGYHLDLQGFNAQVCRDNGVAPGNIHTSHVNTVTSSDYFSHSAGDTSGRFAVMAMLR